MGGQRQKIQLGLAFTREDRGEAPRLPAEGSEPPVAEPEPERPTTGKKLMEEVCDGRNLRKALRRVTANTTRGARALTG